ncbi:MAG: hypothetical protein CMB80_24125 [Flammeovirgaceae bacterium]|nr:hypothetical protein [Flammeovirgaceae bacterium]HCX21766.1 hypothetical protein [Cytophagales bacterium]|tara:strand:+ start:473 stop:1030 length:558 start_codon:yes stop_codon:yes gene_type:complete
MDIKYILAVISVVIGFQASSQYQLKRTKVNDHISIEIPEGFRALEQGEIIQKNVSSRPPIAMYTDYNQQVDIVVNETSNTWQGGDYEVIQSLYKSTIANLFTEIQFIQEGIVEKAGRKFIVFEFVSRVSDEDATFGNNLAISKYTYIRYTLYQDKILLFNFTCPVKQRERWQDSAHEIMNSVRVK